MYCIVGSATPSIKIGYELMMPAKDVPSTLLFAGIRFTLAGFITVLIYSIARRRVLIPKRENLGKMGIVACFQTVIQYIFFYVGLANFWVRAWRLGTDTYYECDNFKFYYE